ncbi:unnamed protein product, partial [Prorocentrum cordatum]
RRRAEHGPRGGRRGSGGAARDVRPRSAARGEDGRQERRGEAEGAARGGGGGVSRGRGAVAPGVAGARRTADGPRGWREPWRAAPRRRRLALAGHAAAACGGCGGGAAADAARGVWRGSTRASRRRRAGPAGVLELLRRRPRGCGLRRGQGAAGAGPLRGRRPRVHRSGERVAGLRGGAEMPRRGPPCAGQPRQRRRVREGARGLRGGPRAECQQFFCPGRLRHRPHRDWRQQRGRILVPQSAPGAPVPAPPARGARPPRQEARRRPVGQAADRGGDGFVEARGVPRFPRGGGRWPLGRLGRPPRGARPGPRRGRGHGRARAHLLLPRGCAQPRLVLGPRAEPGLLLRHPVCRRPGLPPAQPDHGPRGVPARAPGRVQVLLDLHGPGAHRRDARRHDLRAHGQGGWVGRRAVRVPVPGAAGPRRGVRRAPARAGGARQGSRLHGPGGSHPGHGDIASVQKRAARLDLIGD